MPPKTYQRANSITFRSTRDPFGALSNMASGYPITINGLTIPSSEALYQALRFPHLPDVQRTIFDAANAMLAKRATYPHRPNTRTDWDAIRVPLMEWVLRTKLSQHPSLRKLLLSTGTKSIVEDSAKDAFWGAIPTASNQELIGTNTLGELLMKLRGELSLNPNALASIPSPTFQLTLPHPRVLSGNMFETNMIPIITTNTHGVMGAGTAKQAAQRGLVPPHLPHTTVTQKEGVVLFPTKEGSPRTKSTLNRIRQSAQELAVILKANPQTQYVMPPPGIGLGRINPQDPEFSEVVSIVSQLLNAHPNLHLIAPPTPTPNTKRFLDLLQTPVSTPPSTQTIVPRVSDTRFPILPMKYFMAPEQLRADLRPHFPTGISTAELAHHGLRTSTTRDTIPEWWAPGMRFQMQDSTGKVLPGIFVVDGVQRADLRSPETRRQWELHEGWDLNARTNATHQINQGTPQLLYHLIGDPTPLPKPTTPLPAIQDLSSLRRLKYRDSPNPRILSSPLDFLKQIISGGQTGVDMGGLLAGRQLGLQTGGYAPHGYRNNLENISGPEYEQHIALMRELGLIPHPGRNYPDRSMANVDEADASLAFYLNPEKSGSEGAGTSASIGYARGLGWGTGPKSAGAYLDGRRPIFIANTLDPTTWAKEFLEFLQTVRPETLNIIGHGNNAGIPEMRHDEATRRALVSVLSGNPITNVGSPLVHDPRLNPNYRFKIPIVDKHGIPYRSISTAVNALRTTDPKIRQALTKAPHTDTALRELFPSSDGSLPPLPEGVEVIITKLLKQIYADNPTLLKSLKSTKGPLMYGSPRSSYDPVLQVHQSNPSLGRNLYGRTLESFRDSP